MILQFVRWMNLKLVNTYICKLPTRFYSENCSKHSPSFDFQLAFKGGYFLVVLTKIMPKTLGIKVPYSHYPYQVLSIL